MWIVKKKVLESCKEGGLKREVALWFWTFWQIFEVLFFFIIGFTFLALYPKAVAIILGIASVLLILLVIKFNVESNIDSEISDSEISEIKKEESERKETDA